VALADRVPEDPEQDGVDVADRPRGQRAACAADLEQVAVQAVELGGGDEHETAVAQPRQDVDGEVALVALQRRLAQVLDPQGRQPSALDVLRQSGCQVGRDVSAGVQLGEDRGERPLGLPGGAEATPPYLRALDRTDVTGVDDHRVRPPGGVLGDAAAPSCGVGHERPPASRRLKIAGVL
jgi:hypothetical protein